MWKVSLFVFTAIIIVARAQDDEGPYRGKLIGHLNTYHHQVSGDVFAVDDHTILLVDFNYDGTGEDTFFWAGDSGRPGPQGFIVPNEHGNTNILERYHDAEVRLSLPEGKRLSRLKWVAVYDLGSQNAFGDVFVPDEFEAPAPKTIGPLAAVNAGSAPPVASQPIRVLDAVTLLIPEFRYDGSGEEVYFWIGSGAQPSNNGRKIPDEDGYLEPLRQYAAEDVVLRLPGALTVFAADWVALWDARARRALGAALLPADLNVPPAPAHAHLYRSSLPNCRQLHRDYQVSWEVFGNQITIELAAKISEQDYMSFGISGSAGRSSMLGADVAVARYSASDRRGHAADYNITALAPCVHVLGQWVGVCRDTKLGGLDSNQVFSADRVDGVTRVSYRRTLRPEDSMDLEWLTSSPAHVVWALGPLDATGEPAYHRVYPRADVSLKLVREASDPPALANDCFPFSLSAPPPVQPWDTAELFDPALRTFWFRLGPAAGARGAGRGRRPAPPLVWYVNGQLAPDLQLRRGLVYSFKVLGGNDPHSASEYHPLIVTADAAGGLERLSERQQRAQRVLAGVHSPRRGRLAPTAAGAKCVGTRPADADPRRDASFASFRAFNRTLTWRCDGLAPADLTIAPDSSWPDIVYYNSFTHNDMGGRIFIVDRHRRDIARRGAASAARPSPAVALALLISSLQMLILNVATNV
ncbi:protein Skeletor, isoforms B/C [Plodia interpunctella]|uniref:protein Skeletor, isoforms B/C n=1 Tax=Plodia interpunctella TaxID=58824 RepID=UPI002368BA65|nr:protein Skeletor, isoforms B/C [Plodia interpunctella]